MEKLRKHFTDLLPTGGRILDAGCGSGRDTKAFLDGGYMVEAFDASQNLARLASDFSGIDVACTTFADYETEEPFDGIWACASLLHVPRAELPATLRNLGLALLPRGILYASFKLGTAERHVGNRYFNDMTQESFSSLLELTPRLTSKEYWITEDSRPEREEQWLNALVRRSK
jgi:2-polyprenyl-3-methyl-5-hydroxy-6-metoxy-1,4-benzoquinol methylase